jgi:hypothetical protein
MARKGLGVVEWIGVKTDCGQGKTLGSGMWLPWTDVWGQGEEIYAEMTGSNGDT